MSEFNWRPGIGDPTVGGWLTVVLYIVTAVVCWRVARSLGRGDADTRSEAFAWSTIAVLFLALGINKQLDLQSAVTEIGRVLAHAQGWYEQRGAVQVVFVAAIGGICLLAALTFLFLIRRAPAITWLAALGTVAVLAFVGIRAASFHHVDRFIGEMVFGLRWNWILEMGGILMVLIAGLRRK